MEQFTDNMKPIKEIKIGSSVFFSKMPGYKVKDYDKLCIMDSWINGLTCTNILNTKIGDDDIFMAKNMNKNEFIEDTLNCDLPMRAGKFLIPEFAEYLGMTIEDLSRLEPCFNNIDYKHKYEKFIYESYLKNGKFELSEEQLKSAYEIYKKCRGL